MEILIGREKETGELHHSLQLSLSGKGCVVLVSGDSGVGKTAFVEEVLSSHGVKVYTARADENVNTPYSLFTNIFRTCLSSNSNADCGPLKKYLAVILPEIGTPPDDIDAETLKESIATAVITLSTSKPLIIFFDDIHWADNASLEIIPLVADRIKNYPILIICTYRSDEVAGDHDIRKLRSELKRRRKLKEISLLPLSQEGTRELAETILQAGITGEAADMIYSHSLGFPLFIEEILLSLDDCGLLETRNGLINITAGTVIPLPETIKDSVRQRMNKLSDSSKDVLKTASLLGSQFRIDTLVKITSMAEDIDELFAKKWLLQSDEVFACFRHSLIKDAVKETINRSQKIQMHKTLAVYFKDAGAPPEVIASHLFAAGETEEAVESLIKLMDNNIAVYAFEDALITADKILELLKNDINPHKRLHVLKSSAICAQLTGKIEKALTLFNEIITIADTGGNNMLLAETYRLLAGVYALQANWELFISARIKAAELFIVCGYSGEAASEYLAAASKTTALLQLSKAADLAQLAVSIAASSENINVQTRALGLYGNILAMTGKPDEGYKIVQDALELALKNNETEAASEIYRRLANTLEYASDYHGARATYLNAYDFCLNNGKEISARVCLSCMSFIFFHTGEWKRALEIGKEVINSKYTPLTSIPVGYGVAGIIQALRGETKTAVKNLNTSLTLSRKYNIPIMELTALWGMALNSEFNGDFNAALNTYNAIYSVWNEVPETHDVTPALLTSAIFFGRNNMKKELAQALSSISAISSRDTSPEAMAVLSLALAESFMLNNDLNRALQHYYQSLAHIEKPGLPLEQLLIEYRTGIAEAKNNSMEKAEKLMARAYRAARNLGARPLASDIADSMIKLGFKPETERNPESPSRIGKLGLTQRQYEILELIGEGLLNKEIAAKLFLSTRTIDMHVSHILQRLNCRTRTEAISKAKEMNQGQILSSAAES